MNPPSKKKSHIDKAVLAVGLLMLLILIAYLYSLHKSGTQYSPEYRKVAAEVGPQFDKIVHYLERVERAYPNAQNSARSKQAFKQELEQAANRKQGEFRFRLANMGSYQGQMAYCLEAESTLTHGRAYHSSLPVNDPTWQGKRSYYHYVTGQEPVPDLGGPCNEQVIRGGR